MLPIQITNHWYRTALVVVVALGTPVAIAASTSRRSIPAPPTAQAAGVVNCAADFDRDGDVDAADRKAFEGQFTGANPHPPVAELGPAPSNGAVTFEATADVWIRECCDAADRTYERDMVSVWSSSTNGNPDTGSRRYGLIEFDVRALADKNLSAAHLRLWVADSSSGTTRPVKQRAFVIDSGGTPLKSLTWNTFMKEKDASKKPMRGLGRYDAGAPSSNGTAGKYLDDSGARAGDLALIQAEAKGDGLLSIVLIADEDGTDYRGDWGDGTNAGGPGYTSHPAHLIVVTGPPCHIVADTLPDGTVGEPYTASLTASDDCWDAPRWGIVKGGLPGGLSVNATTGKIEGTPKFGSTYAFRVQLRGEGAAGAPEADFAIAVGCAPADFDKDGDVDAADRKAFDASFTGELDPDRNLDWRAYVIACLDTLIEYGTDHYGPVNTPMLMSILDVNTLTSPETPPMLDANVRTEGRPDHGRRSPGGSNLWLDMPTLRVMYRISELTGDTKYADAANAYMRSAFERAVKPNGMLAWGSHIYYHAFKDRPGGDQDGRGPHEILIKHAMWEKLAQINPVALRREVDGIWKWHIIDKQTGLHNRHDDGHKGCDFAFSGGSFAMAFCAMYKITKEQHYLDQAKIVAGWHWRNRNPETGLVPDSPGTGGRFDAHHCFTTITGPHASQLLRCYELTGDKYFRDLAFAYIKAYEKYGWDEAARSYYAMLKLDGTPVPQHARGSGYDAWIPYGHVDVWRTVMYSYEFPLIAAESTVYAYRLADNDEDRAMLLRAALRWAEVIARECPPHTGRRWKTEIEAALPKVTETSGTYAENYGRAISFFVSLYHITNDIEHLRQAKALAREAVTKLYVNGIFRGHPAKDYYQANDGVGFLLSALMQLDALPKPWRLAF